MIPNPYLTIEGCVNRLYKQWQKHPRLIVAVDFDDSIFPYSGDYDYSDTINVLKRAQKHKFIIVIYTVSMKERYPEIIKYCKEIGIDPIVINKDIIDLTGNPEAKIYYNILLDDKAFLGGAIEILNKTIDLIEGKEPFWPTLQGRLANPITTEKQAVDQMMQICPEIVSEETKRKYGYDV